jgi:cholesterol transport system auxiliary component
MSRRLALPAALLLAAGCAGVAPPQQPAMYDLGPPAATAASNPPFPLRSVDVAASTWLDSSALQYRLAYADSGRRHSYAESRWVATPREMIERALERAIVSSEATGRVRGCRLRIDLDEFVHYFDAPGSSAGVVEARAVLLAARDDALLARQRFSVRRPAPSADARGGVAALSAGVTELSAELRAWLEGLSGNAAVRLPQACAEP